MTEIANSISHSFFLIHFSFILLSDHYLKKEYYMTAFSSTLNNLTNESGPL